MSQFTSFFTNLATALKGPLGQIGQQEMATIAPALGTAVVGALTNPTKAGLIAAAAPAVVKIAATQPQILVEVLTDLFAAVGQLENPPQPVSIAPPPVVPPKVG